MLCSGQVCSHFFRKPGIEIGFGKRAKYYIAHLARVCGSVEEVREIALMLKLQPNHGCNSTVDWYPWLFNVIFIKDVL